MHTGSRAATGAREDARRRRPVKQGVPRAMAGVLGAPALALAAYRRRAIERRGIVEIIILLAPNRSHQAS